MKRCAFIGLLLAALLVVTAGIASADNLLVNGSFQSGDFTGWYLGTTPNGTPGVGFPIITTWPQGGMNAAEYDVGEITYTGEAEGVRLWQYFVSGGGWTELGFSWDIIGPLYGDDPEGGRFALLLDGVVLSFYDYGYIKKFQWIAGSERELEYLAPGQHVFEIDITRRFLSNDGWTPPAVRNGSIRHSSDAGTGQYRLARLWSTRTCGLAPPQAGLASA
jgi:hypothetical protein